MKGSKRILWLIGAWVAATAATAGVAMAVVGLAGDQLTNEAVEPLSAAEVEALGVPAPVPAAATTAAPVTEPADTATAPADPGVTTTSPSVTATSVPPATTATTSPAASPGTTVPASTTTTQAGATTTTTTIPETAQVDSRKITGGTVVVRWTSSSVELVSASPDDGYSVDVEKRGPGKVEVEFEGGGITSKYAAEVSDGQLMVQTEVESEEGGD